MRTDNDDYARPSGSEKVIRTKVLDEAGAMEKLEEDMSEGALKQYISPLLICDSNTSKAAGETMEDIFDRCQVLVLDTEDLRADEYAIEIVENYMEEDIDLVLAFGEGPIHDIGRYIAWKYKIPYVFLPTRDIPEKFSEDTAVIFDAGEPKIIPVGKPVAVYADSDIMDLVSEYAEENRD